MRIKGLLKRIAPFFLTFALGLFVASFFVSVALPNMRFNRGFRKHKEYHRKLECENRRLKEENSRLKSEAQQNSDFNGDINSLVPPPPPIPVHSAPYKK